MPLAISLHVYDLSRGMAATMSQQILGRQIDYVPHTGIVVGAGLAGAKEYFFGGGIQALPPSEVVRAFGLSPVQVLPLGTTTKTLPEFHAWIASVRHRFTEQTYDLFRHNCNNFSDEAARFLLGGAGIPRDIIDLPRQVLETPIGQMIAPMLSNQMNTMNSSVAAAGGRLNLNAPAPPLAAVSTAAPVPASASAPAVAARSYPPVAGPPVNITVKGQTGGAGTFAVTLPGAGAETGQLRDAISSKMNCPSETVRIIFMGKVLSVNSAGGATLQQYGIQDGHTVLVARSSAPASSAASAGAGAGAAAAAAATRSAPAAAPAGPSSDPVERGIALMLIRAPKEQALVALKTLNKVCSNIKDHPMEDKYRRLKIANQAFQNRVTKVPGGLDILRALGFKVVTEGEDAGCYILTPSAELWNVLVSAQEKIVAAIGSLNGGNNNNNNGGSIGGGASGGAAPPVLPGAGGLGALAQQLGNMDPAAMQAMMGQAMNNPAIAQMLGSMGGGGLGPGLMGNPDVMQQAMQMMQNPQMMQQAMQMMQNPQMMQQMQQAMGSMAGGQMPGAAPGAGLGPQGAPANNNNGLNQMMQQILGGGGGGGAGTGGAQKSEEEMLNEAIMRSLREQ
jgi:hypothetical protein